MRVFLYCIVILILTGLPATAQKVVLDEKEFSNPSAVYKPKTWMHALSGNMSKGGLTKDLESIEKVGFGGVFCFSMCQPIFPQEKLVTIRPNIMPC